MVSPIFSWDSSKSKFFQEQALLCAYRVMVSDWDLIKIQGQGSEIALKT